jgi:hypothetical protein
MLIIGSAILLVMLLLVAAIRIAFGLIKLSYYLVKLIVYLVATVVLGIVLLCRWLTRSHRQEPVLTIYVDEVDDEGDGPVIDLPRDSYRRERG